MKITVLQPRYVESALWLAGITLMAITVAGWRTADSRHRQDGIAIPQLSVRGVAWSPDSLELNARVAAEKDPFRLSRRAATAAYGAPATEPVALPTFPPPEPRPRLVLRGILGGPPWQALIEGMPGRDGNIVVRAGDIVGKLRITRLGPDTVTVTGADTTWHLTLHGAWQ